MKQAMNCAKLFVFFSILMFAMSPAYPQATPAPAPGDKPNVFLQKEPPVDKSRLRDLKGVVKDDGENPVEGAVVQLKNLKTGKVVQFITKKDGLYLFYDLSMDIDYELLANREGYVQAPKKTVTKYDSRKPATVNLQMERKKPA